MVWPTSSANSAQIQNWYKKAYVDRIRIGAGELNSPARDTVDQETLTGEHLMIDNYEKLDISAVPSDDSVIERLQRFADNSFKDVTRARTALITRHWEFTHWVDPRDMTRVIKTLRPDGQFQRVALGGFARRATRLLVEAILGARLDGALASKTAANDNVISIDVDFDTANSNLILAKVIELRKQMENNGVQRDVPWTFLCHPNQMYALLGQAAGSGVIPTVASADFNTVRTLVGGMMNDGYMGFDNWRMTTEIDDEVFTGASSVATGKNAYGYAMDGMVFGTDGEVDIRFDERDDKGHLLQIAHYWDANATRVMGLKVGHIECVT